MVCGGCGATIADKAIVCYRCGTPTAGPAAPSRAGGAPRRQSLAVSVVLAVVALVLVWAAATAPHGSTVHFLLAGGGVLALVLAVVTFYRSRR
jgi:hypothetical protein